MSQTRRIYDAPVCPPDRQTGRRCSVMLVVEECMESVCKQCCAWIFMEEEELDTKKELKELVHILWTFTRCTACFVSLKGKRLCCWLEEEKVSY